MVKKVFDINVFGVYSTTQNFAPLLLKAKGTIVNIGSIIARIHGAYASPYGASKAALEMISHAMRQEMEPLGMHVTHVSFAQILFSQVANFHGVAKITVGVISSHCWDNMPPKTIPETSLYFPIREKAEAIMTPAGNYMSPSEFADDVFVRITKSNPPALFWSGSMIWPPRIINVFEYLFGPRVWDLAAGGVSGLNDLRKLMSAREAKKKAA
jgi:1-acylglycerone phosphate reductase